MKERATIRVLKENYLAEREAAEQYRALAEREKDVKRQKILYKLAEQEENHAARWATRLRTLGADVPEPLAAKLAWKRLVMRSLDDASVLKRLEADEEMAEKSYSKILHQVDDQELIAELEEVKREEEVHGKVVRAMYAGEVPYRERETRSKLETLLKRERWHVKSASWLGDAIYGANDGLGAVFGIVSGVAGATGVASGQGSSNFVLISGLAGMIASAVSMGSSAYLAAKSEREVFESEMHRERVEMEENPEEEIEELSLIYQLRGFSETESNDLARKLAETPEEFLKVKGAEELGLSEMSFPSPWNSMASGGISTALGAFVPLIPFFFTGGMKAIVISFIISLVAHFLVGAAKSVITVRSWWKSGLEMMMVGVLVAVVTYGLGVLFHVSAG
jgi:VIT1/CCC1 family predicted Fe2+/Mn2+ transporter/rubrerythrin